MKISFGITTRNEGQYLSNLLNNIFDNVGDYEYEIIILDDFSDDSLTQDIISKVATHEKVKVYQHALNNNFAVQKNFLTSKCTGDYIFQIDADETPSKYILTNLETILDSNDVDLYWVPRINTVEGLTQEHIQRWGWRISKLENIVDEKILDTDSGEYKLLTKYGLIIEENTMKKLVKFYVPIINWSDRQSRIYKNSPEIKWKYAVHEIIGGHKSFAYLPDMEQCALTHHKTISRQEFQNQMYSKITRK